VTSTEVKKNWGCETFIYPESQGKVFPRSQSEITDKSQIFQLWTSITTSIMLRLTSPWNL